jgi:penicillin-binding protein 1C
MKGTSGVTGAGPIFHDVMIEAMKNQEMLSFPRPRSISEQRICKLSGKLPTPLCPETITEYFVSGTQPRENDDMYRLLPIDTRTGLLARESCEKGFVASKPFVVFPSELKTWARENGWAVPPDAYSPLCSIPMKTVDESSDVRITSPGPGTSFLLDPLIPNDQERVILTAVAPVNVESGQWFINDQLVATAVQPDFKTSWIPTAGRHTVRFTTENLNDQVDIEVFMPTE